MKKTITLVFAAIIALQNVNAQNWLTTGNAGLTSGNFIGTTDAAPLIFKVKNNASGRIDFLSTKAGTALGFQAMKANSGAGNTAFGYLSMTANTFGYANTSAGQYSMNKNVDGFSNTAFGSEALRQNVSGSLNTAFGQAALAGSTSGDNTAVGRYSLLSVTTGGGNTALGSATNVNDGTLTNLTLLGFYATGTASNQVRVGNSSVTSIGGQVGWSTLSDARVKNNIKQNVPGLAFINKLQPITYNLNLNAVDQIIQMPTTDATGKTIQFSTQDIAARKAKEQIIYSGFAAQDVEKIAKGLGYDFSGVDAAKNSKDLYGLRYAEFVVPLVKAVQELDANQNAEVKSQNEKIIALQKQIDDLKALITSNQSSAIVTKQNASNALKAVSSFTISMAPNPVQSSAVLSISGNTKKVSVTMSDINGKALWQQQNISSNQINLPIQNFAAGIYMVSVTDGSEIKMVKLVKE